MSFFKLSNGEQFQSTGEHEAGGDLEPIPAKTQVKAAITSAEWYTPKDSMDRLISIKWQVLAPKEYANRVIFQKLKVLDDDESKRDKAIKMLAAVDKNAGGKLMASGEEPDDMALMMCLCNKPMVLMLSIWKMDDKTGNWVSAVSPLAKKAAPAPVADEFEEVPAPKLKPAPAPAADDFDDIPF